MRPPRSRAVRLRRGTKKPLDSRWPTLVLPDRLYLTRRRNWGVRAGNGLWILDFDAKEGHLQALSDLEAEHGRIPGWRVRTPSGGLHIYLGAPDGDRRASRIPVNGCEKGVELKTHAGQYVVWAGGRVRGCEYVSEGLLPRSLPEAPAWLVGMTKPTPVAVVAMGGGQTDAERDRFGTPAEYVGVILGLEPDSNGCIRCPTPEHKDEEPSCQVRGHNLRCWTHPGGPLTLWARQLAAIAAGVGECRDGSWKIDAPEDRSKVRERLAELFPELKGVVDHGAG
jgi:hypothetical protein